MIRRLALALLLAMTAGAAWLGSASAHGLVRVPPPRPSAIPEPSSKRTWDVKLFQVDKANTLVGNPIEFTCGPVSCETPVKLDVAGKPAAFLVVLTFVPRGAYFALQPQQDGITKAVEFEKTYVGPTFLQMRGKPRFSTVLRFTLVGPAMRESEEHTAQMMDNQRSRVFQRKVEPDVILRVALSQAAEGELKPVQ